MTRHTLTNEWTEVADAATAVTVQHLRGDRVQVVFAADLPDKRLPAAAVLFLVPAYGASDFAPTAGLKAFARARGRAALAEVTTAAEAPPEALAVEADGVAAAAFAPPVVADVAVETFATRLLTVRRDAGLLAGARNLDLDRFRAALVVSTLAEGATSLPVGAGAALASGARLRVTEDGAFTFDPRAAFAALAAGAPATETVTFTVSNGGATASATLTITVRGTGGPPLPGRSPEFGRDFGDGFRTGLRLASDAAPAALADGAWSLESVSFGVGTYTAGVDLPGDVAEAQWTTQASPTGLGAGWEPLVFVGGRPAGRALWRFGSVPPADYHTKVAGQGFANVGVRWRTESSDWSPVSATRKAITLAT